VRGVTLARADSTPVMTDLSGTRMDPLDRAPLRQRIVSIVLSAPSQVGVNTDFFLERGKFLLRKSSFTEANF
jgi:hypothetical protein